MNKTYQHIYTIFSLFCQVFWTFFIILKIIVPLFLSNQKVHFFDKYKLQLQFVMIIVEILLKHYEIICHVIFKTLTKVC